MSDEAVVFLMLLGAIAAVGAGIHYSTELGKEYAAYEDCRVEQKIDIRLKQPVRTCVEP